MLSQIIKEIQTEIRSKIDNLNSGGCGWFAFYMATALKSVGIEAEIKLITRHEEDLWFTSKDDINFKKKVINFKKKVINEYINNGKKKCDPNDLQGISFVHCYLNVAGLQFDGVYEDMKGVQTKYSRFKFEGTYSLDEMKIALEVGGWNPTYDASNNTTLKDIIESKLRLLPQPVQLA